MMKMSLNSGVCIGCDYPGCYANSDMYPEARGARLNNMKNLYKVIEANGWVIDAPSEGVVKYYCCREHANDKNMAYK